LNAAFGPDPFAPQFTIQNLYQLADNITWTKGKHSFKFGFDGWSSISPSSFTQRSRGDYEWSYLSDFLYDTYPDGIAQRSLGSVTYYQNQQLYSFFGNDVWKVTPHLTVNLGLRYEYLTLPLGENTQVLNQSASVPGLIEFNKPKTQKTNFMPRIGIAYSPGTSGKTALRAGFGISYDVLYNNLGTLSLPPQLSTTVDQTGLSGFGFLAGGGIPPTGSVTVPEGADARAVTSGYIPDQQRPEAYNWNIGIQHEFGSGYVFESRYVGTRGLYLPMQVQPNIQSTVNSSNALPLFLSAPSQATLNALPNVLCVSDGAGGCSAGLQAQFNNGGNIVPAYANAGFLSPITAFMPVGNSTYHGWSNQLSKRLTNGLQFQGSYTWSHNIDDSTSALDSTVLAPRRPQDFQNLRAERASSLLDHRHRIVLEMIYDVPFFRNSNWFVKNLIGNWEVAPTYTFQSGQLVTAQSAVDANFNGDSAPDRVFINPAGNASVGSDVTPLTNGAGQTVAYLANNPSAGYITAGLGQLPNGGRNTLQLNPINNIDLTLVKRFSITERFKAEFSARAYNLINHPQYAGGYLNDVAPVLGGGAGEANGDLQRTSLEPFSSVFQQYSQTFTSNPRMLQLALKLVF
jgi:outer membrane receptor protein involved in Fe transport